MRVRAAGANLSKLVAVGPTLILQEFGNLGTIFISLPIALLLGLKKEAIGCALSTFLAKIINIFGKIFWENGSLK